MTKIRNHYRRLNALAGPTDRWLRSLKRKGGDAYCRFWNLVYPYNPFVHKEVLCPQRIRK